MSASRTTPRVPALARRPGLRRAGGGDAGVDSNPTGSWPETKVPGARELRLISRFTYGWAPGLSQQIAAAGGPEAWFERQLEPDSVPDPLASLVRDEFPLVSRSVHAWAPGINAVNFESAWQRWDDFENLVLAQRTVSRRQVLEVMTEFWEHSLSVPGVTTETFGLFRPDYHEAIKQRALGTFEELLLTAITHPAMGMYLGNAQNTRTAPNENLGREVLELHTLGVGNYTEDDVKSSARILTGWRVRTVPGPPGGGSAFSWDYDPTVHWTGPVRVLGFADPNADPDGRDLTRRYLSYLARHPATARRIAYRLAVRFVSDRPSSSLVNRLAEVYLSSGTEIKPVLRALVRSPELMAAPRRLRTPTEDVVATLRAVGADLGAPGQLRDIHYLNWLPAQLGAGVFQWPRPDGEPLESQAWASVARMLGSFAMHWDVAGGWWSEGMTWLPRPETWIPRTGMRFDDFVDHVSRRVLGVASDRRLLTACCLAASKRPRDPVAPRGTQLAGFVQQTLGTVLDSPQHLTR